MSTVPTRRYSSSGLGGIAAGGGAAGVLEAGALGEVQGRIRGEPNRRVRVLIAIVNGIAPGAEAVANDGAVGELRVAGARQVKDVMLRQQPDRLLKAGGGHVVAVVVEIPSRERRECGRELADDTRRRGDGCAIGRDDLRRLEIGEIMVRRDGRHRIRSRAEPMGRAPRHRAAACGSDEEDRWGPRRADLCPEKLNIPLLLLGAGTST